MIHQKLLDKLVCPETRQPLREAPSEMVDRANALVARGTLQNQAGKNVATRLDGGLLRSDGQVVYPISGGIPILLAEEGIATSQLEG